MAPHATGASGKLPSIGRRKLASCNAKKALIFKEISVKNVRRIANLVEMVPHATSALGKLPLIGILKAVFYRARKARTSKEIGAFSVR